MGDTKATGLAALEQRLEELRASDEDLNTNVIGDEEVNSVEESQEVAEPEPKEKEVVAQTEAKGETKASTEEAPQDASDSNEEVNSAPKGETKEQEENVYSPNYQYKFQDEMFEFDDRVKSAIKTSEDEEFFRDLYTKSRAMELMKERAEETSKNLDEYKGKYSSLESQTQEKETMINYFSQIMDGVNRGDPKAFNQFLSLCDANPQALQNLALTMAEHLENPTGYDNLRQMNQAQYQQQNVQRSTQDLEYQQAELARQQTDLEVKKAIQNPEIADLVKYVDDTWGPGTFEKRVWSEGEAMEKQNKSVSLAEIPSIVKNVADWFGKAKPANTSESKTITPKAPVPTKERIVENPTEALPQVKGDRGVPEKPIYSDGAGIEGLQKRYKEITGSEW
jgi:hypothetical protein